jgi:hypothetical protein
VGGAARSWYSEGRSSRRRCCERLGGERQALIGHSHRGGEFVGRAAGDDWWEGWWWVGRRWGCRELVLTGKEEEEEE